MELIISSVKIIHVLVSFILILVVLLQPGKGGDLGSIFGGGTSDSIFGSSGAVPFLSKVTRVLAVLFFISSLSLGYFAVRGVGSSVVTDTAPSVFEETAPVEGTADDAAMTNEIEAGGEVAPEVTEGENKEAANGEEVASEAGAEAPEEAAPVAAESDTAAPQSGTESVPEEKPADTAAQ